MAEELTVHNIYLPYQKKIKTTDIKYIVQQLLFPFILWGDLNSNSPIWGCNKIWNTYEMHYANGMLYPIHSVMTTFQIRPKTR